MNSLNLYSIIASLLIGKVFSQSKDCDFYQVLKADTLYTISSPKYSQNYPYGSDCRWSAEAPPGYKIALSCDSMALPSTFLCMGDKVLVSRTGRTDVRDGKAYCGASSFNETSTSNRMTIALKTWRFSRGGRFKCTLRAVTSSCTCGQLNRGKIVGGSQTQVNEYPSMAGVVDANEKRIFCGATIISTTHALSAAHCRLNRVLTQLGLLVGEHDLTKGTETSFTVLHRIAAFTSHPNFNADNSANDIALIRTQNVMTFTKGVQPACLPFKYRGVSLVNNTVQGLGWGATEFSGPQSNVLLQVTLTIVNRGNCSSNQLCSFAANKDTCQSDSGGPLFYLDNSIIFNVGIVSTGVACATKEPSVNTRVTSYLDWIQQETRSTTYCVR